MKAIRYVFLISMIIASAQSIAQNFSFKGGLNLADIKFSPMYGTDGENKLKPGFHIGANIDVPIGEVFSVETGMLFGTKGQKHENLNIWGEGTYYKSELTLYYIDIPVLAKLTLKIREARIYIGTGPFIGVGLTGNRYVELKYEQEINTLSEEVNWVTKKDGYNDINFNGGLRRLDFGLSSVVGFEIKGLFLEAGYNLGMANINTKSNSYYMRNRVLIFSVGYRFRKTE